jgi:hypothetical protein
MKIANWYVWGDVLVFFSVYGGVQHPMLVE